MILLKKKSAEMSFRKLDGLPLITVLFKGFTVFVVFFFFFGCASRRFPMVRQIPDVDRVQIAQERAQNYFVKAQDYERRGLFKMAEQFYELAYELDPASVVLRDILVKKFIISRKYKQALLLIKGDKKNEALSDKEKRIAASLYVEMQQLGKAAEIFESLSTVSVSERATLGYIYERLKNSAKSIENYSICFNEKPQLDIGMKLADLFIQEKKLDQAESLYVLLEGRFENNAEIVNRLGVLNLIKRDTVSAMNFFNTALIIDSSSAEAMNNMAQIYIARGDYKEAINWYKKITRDDFLSKFYHRRTLGLLFYYDKQYTEAQEILQSLLTENVDDYELHYYLGLVFAAQKRYAMAEIELRKTLAIKDNYVDAWLHLCYLALRQDNWKKAEEVARRFKERLPETGASWRMYGFALNTNKKFKEAIEILKKALTFDPDNPTVWFELGSALERSGNYKKATEAFSKVLQLKPEDDAAANYLGYMWAEQNKNLDSAKVLLEMALKEEPENGAYLDSYGWIFFKLGDMENAEKYILEALKQIDDDPIVHTHLGDILAKKGDVDGAVEAYQRSIKLGSEDKEALEEKINSLVKPQK